MSEILTCSSDGCDEQAVEMLELRGMPGHVHDCSVHAHDLREWCDVTASGSIVDNACPAFACTGNRHIWHGAPTPLEDA
jgi:hypothetical protein